VLILVIDCVHAFIILTGSLSVIVVGLLKSEPIKYKHVAMYALMSYAIFSSYIYQRLAFFQDGRLLISAMSNNADDVVMRSGSCAPEFYLQSFLVLLVVGSFFIDLFLFDAQRCHYRSYTGYQGVFQCDAWHPVIVQI
jgi:hypothetical protein